MAHKKVNFPISEYILGYDNFKANFQSMAARRGKKKASAMARWHWLEWRPCLCIYSNFCIFFNPQLEPPVSMLVDGRPKLGLTLCFYCIYQDSNSGFKTFSLRCTYTQTLI